MEPIIIVKNVGKAFAEKPGEKVEALANVNLEVAPSEFFVLVGPSGCGKSTLLRIMSGLDAGHSGHVATSPSVKPGDVGFVFQNFALFPWLTVYQNIALGLLSQELQDNEIRNRVGVEIQRFKLEKFAHAYPHELSGGMKQRVGLARAFIINPKIMFMDEPFSELDSFTAAELRRELIEIWKERKPTIVLVTHIIEEALELADRVAVLTPRPGTIEKIVRVNLARPRGRRSPEFYALEDELSALIRY